MRLTDNGRHLIQEFEGLMLTAYRDPPLPKRADGSDDPNQLWSIGYGHQLPRGRSWAGHTITRAEADEYFKQDVVKFEAAVSLKTPNAAPHEFDAMTSLAYNIGTGGFSDSTVARLHNIGDRQGAADAFRMWKKSGGQDNPVLIKRREKERAIYLNGYTPPGSFPTPPPNQSTPGWPETIATAPSSAPTPSAYKGASIAAFMTLALGWLVYRLTH